MSDRAFLDTNVFVYSIDNADQHKMRIAQQLIREHTASQTAVISFQVVQEFFNVALNKFPAAMAQADAIGYLHTVLRPLMTVGSSVALYEIGLDVRNRYQLSWYDSLIIAAAAEANCSVLYTEGLQHGAKIDGIRVENPFLKKRAR